MAEENSFWNQADDFWKESGDENWEESILSDDDVIIEQERNPSYFDNEDGDDEWFSELMTDDESISNIPADIKQDPSLSKWIPTTTQKKTTDSARYAFNYLSGKGLPKHVAAGIVGNLMKESNLNPNSVEKGNTGNGRGIAQWDVRNRWKDYQNFSKQRGSDDLDTQLDFVIHEAEKRGDLQKTLQAQTPQEAAMIFGRTFERPNEKYADWETRQAYANDLMQMKFGGIRKVQYGDAYAVQNIPNQMFNGIDDAYIQEYLDGEVNPLDEDNEYNNIQSGQGTMGAIANTISTGVETGKKVNNIRKFFDKKAMETVSDLIDVQTEISGANKNAATLRKFNALKNTKQYQFNRNPINNPLIYT